MLGLGHQDRFYLCRRATDMRKSFDGLSGLIRNELDRNPLNGEVYIFLNGRRNMVKLLVWDNGGFAIYSKRLEQGTYELPKVIHNQELGQALRWSELLLILEGVSLKSVRFRKRYGRENKITKKVV